jgi:CheY-like chemotaxis protein
MMRGFSLFPPSSFPPLFSGTGLGLTVCSELVKLMGGVLTVQSKLGHGASFAFIVVSPLLDPIIPAEACVRDTEFHSPFAPPRHILKTNKHSSNDGNDAVRNKTPMVSSSSKRSSMALKHMNKELLHGILPSSGMCRSKSVSLVRATSASLTSLPSPSSLSSTSAARATTSSPLSSMVKGSVLVQQHFQRQRNAQIKDDHIVEGSPSKQAELSQDNKRKLIARDCGTNTVLSFTRVLTAPPALTTSPTGIIFSSSSLSSSLSSSSTSPPSSPSSSVSLLAPWSRSYLGLLAPSSIVETSSASSLLANDHYEYESTPTPPHPVRRLIPPLPLSPPSWSSIPIAVPFGVPNTTTLATSTLTTSILPCYATPVRQDMVPLFSLPRFLPDPSTLASNFTSSRDAESSVREANKLVWSIPMNQREDNSSTTTTSTSSSSSTRSNSEESSSSSRRDHTSLHNHPLNDACAIGKVVEDKNSDTHFLSSSLALSTEITATTSSSSSLSPWSLPSPSQHPVPNIRHVPAPVPIGVFDNTPLGSSATLKSELTQPSTSLSPLSSTYNNITCTNNNKVTTTITAAIARSDSAVPTTGIDLNGLRILVAEDNVLNQKVFQRLLSRMGHDVTMVSNGQEAFDTFMMHPHGFDVIVMDVHMPVCQCIVFSVVRRTKMMNWRLKIGNGWTDSNTVDTTA